MNHLEQSQKGQFGRELSAALDGTSEGIEIKQKPSPFELTFDHWNNGDFVECKQSMIHFPYLSLHVFPFSFVVTDHSGRTKSASVQRLCAI
jgi:hypothetical protein